MGTRESAVLTASLSVGRFAGSSVCPTHAHTQITERATSVTIGRIGAMHAMRPNNYFCGIVCAIEMYDRRHA